jgi:putative effector of murein hydrolase
MYKQMMALKKTLGRLILVVSVGTMVGMATAGLMVWMLGGSHQLVASAIPKSVTTPIAVQVAQELRGNPGITVAMVLVTGLLGSAVGPTLLRLAGVRHEHALGAGIGASSHAIGTATLIQSSEVQGSVSSLAMVLAGIVTSVLAMGLTWMWR